jgi:hypothetical protein
LLELEVSYEPFYKVSASVAMTTSDSKRKQIVACWEDWNGTGREHLVLDEGLDGIVAESVVIADVDGESIATRYRIECDSFWRVRRAEVSRVGGRLPMVLESDGLGNWRDGAGIAQSRLSGAIDIDISVTPFTNTLPIRRLSMRARQSVEILVVYFLLPALAISTDRQRYTRLDERRYRYESIDSDFTRDIEVDEHGLVIIYPGLFKRLM